MKQIRDCSVLNCLPSLSLNKSSLLKLLLFTALHFALISQALAQISASEVYLSSGESIDSLYINENKISLDKDASDYSSVKNLGPVEKLSSIALKAAAGKEGGLISMISSANKQKIISDDLWKVYPSPDGKEPPADKAGKQWFHADYDDSQWKFATVDGRFGIPPWNTGKKPQEGFKSLLSTMRVYNKEKVLFRYKGSSLNARWIWAGNATYPVKYVYFRRTFFKNKFNTKVPPTRPYELIVSDVTQNKAKLSWQPSFSHLGKLKYRIYWNGLHVKTVSTTKAELTGLGFSTKPKNYVYIRAEDEEGNLSKASPFKIVKIKDKVKPLAPKNPRVVKAGPNMVELTWEAGSDETELRIYYVNIGKVAFIAPPGATNFKYSGKMLKPGTKYKVQIVAVDLDRNRSKPAEISFTTSKNWTPQKPKKLSDKVFQPMISLTGITDRSAVLRWNRPLNNILKGSIQFHSNNSLVHEFPITQVFAEYMEVKGLQAGKAYQVKIVFEDTKGTSISSNTLNCNTVKIPDEKAQRIFSSLTVPDPRHENFKAALLDAKKQGSEFMFTFGNYGPQDRAQDKHWKNFIDAVNLVKKDMPVYMAPSSHDVQATFMDPISNEKCFSSGKYNRFMHHTGRSLNEIIDLNGIRLIWSLSKNYDNFDGELFFQKAVLEANNIPEITHVFVMGPYQETVGDWEKVLANSSKPIITLDRYINGNPGYAVTWEPGESLIQASSQRNRAKSADYQIIHIYENKIYFEQRATDPKSGKYETKLIHAIDYNREKHLVKAGMIRNRHTSGMVLGFNQQVNKHPWAINQKVLLQKGQAKFKLNGVCPLGKDLKFTIIKHPSFGSLTGEGQVWTYNANSKFTGQDHLLFQVDNGLKSQYAWVSFKSY